MRSLPKNVRIVEVGPRDGLQNESAIIPTPKKAEFIQLLGTAGLQDIEVASFVHPNRVPQLADADELVRQLELVPNVRYSALVPNMKGLERAIQRDRKSTRLNSSHGYISYAVFCLKKKKKEAP